MTVKTVYVVRHADRPWNLLGAPTPTGIPGDVALTPHGEEQVKQLTWFMSQPFSDDSRPTPDQIYVSPYWRALQTIRNIPCGTDRLYAEPGLCERILDDGVHPPITLSEKQLRTFPAIDPDYVPVLVPKTGYETREDLIERMELTMESLLERIEEESPEVETILLGTHASPAIAISLALLAKEAKHLHTYTAGVTKYVREDPKHVLGTWKLDWNCRVDFLSGGGESDWSWNKDRANLGRPGPRRPNGHSNGHANGHTSGRKT